MTGDTQTDLTDKDVLGLLQKLRSRYVGERMEAEELFRTISPAGVEALLRLLETENDKRRRRRRIYFTLATVVGTVGIPLITWFVYMAVRAFAAGDPNTGGAYLGGIGGVGGGLGGGILGGFSWLIAPTAVQAMAGEALALIDDVRVSGPLAEAIEGRVAAWRPSRVTIARTLMRLLPRLQPGDRALFTDSQLKALYNVLRRANVEKETEFVLVLLEAVGKVGDMRAAELLDDVAVKHGMTENERSVSTAAAAASSALLARIARERTGETLLRSSTSPSGPSETLVRPAGNAEETDTTILLHPTSADNS